MKWALSAWLRSPSSRGCQGMQPGPLCQLRAGTGGAWGSWCGLALTASPTLLSLRGVSPVVLTALLHHSAGLQPLPRHPRVLMPSPATLFGPGQHAARAGTLLAPGLGEQRV